MFKSRCTQLIVGVVLLIIASHSYANNSLAQSTSGLCLRTADASVAPVNGTQVVLHQSCNDQASAFEWTSGNSIKHVPSGKCVHPGGANVPVNGQRLVLWDGCDFADRVRFALTGANSIQHLSSGKCVHPNGGSATPSSGTPLVMWDGCNENRLAFAPVLSNPNNIAVNINLDVKHAVGAIDSFDRRKFITIHSSHTEEDWFGNNGQSRGAENDDPNLMTNFLETYDVYFGRDTGGMKYQLEQLPENPNRAGFINPDTATSYGGGARWSYTSNTGAKYDTMRSHQDRNTNLVVGAQQHPYWPDGKEVGNMNWAFSQTDTASEPIGTATGDYISQYLSKYFNVGANDPFGQMKPSYIEIMNEPLFELYDIFVDRNEAPIATLQEVFKFHNTVADVIRSNPANDNVKIGGYTVAFPNYEDGVNIFDEWTNRDKYFLDLAGNNMDFISIHLYDFPNIPTGSGTKEQYRKGSNMEATLDMLEQYMAYKWGSNMKPIMVSEYGSQLQGSFGTPWSPERDWLCLKAMNSMLMSFLERPNRIEKAIPFITVKAEWGRVSETVPYYWRLMRQKHESDPSLVGTEEGNKWVYTDQVKFYQLWADVDGVRVDTWASDLDIQTDAYIDGNEAYFIFNSLEFSAKTIDLSVVSNANNNAVSNVEIRHLYPDASGKPVLDIYNNTSIPESVVIGAESTIIMKVSYNNNVIIDDINQETKHYTASELVNITANFTHTFNINGVSKGNFGEAVLRIGLGREHGQSLTPTVFVNGVAIDVPSDYRGYEQEHGGAGRDRFFGVIEVPVPYSILNANNTIGVRFNDNGGAISSVTLQNFSQSREIVRND